MVHYHSKPKLFYLANVWKRLGKAIARKSYTTIARCIFKLPKVLSKLVKGISQLLVKEIKELCSDKFNSIMRESSEHALKHFSWQSIWGEAECKAPTLLEILVACFRYARSGKRHIKATICTVIAMMCKCRNKLMSQVQSVLSVLLHTSHVSKEVRISHSNRKGVCVSLTHLAVC